VARQTWVQPVVLEGTYVRLEPLSLGHIADLTEVGLDPAIWRWMPVNVTMPADIRGIVDAALADAAEGSQVPFATIDRASNRAVGSTRFLAVEPVHRRIEIGWTWLAPRWQRSSINTEAKLLMMRHAFDDLGALRVEYKTDSLNDKSRAALAGIGATEEGTMRSHMATYTERRRHSVYFSVIAEEWPAVRERLEARLARHAREPEGDAPSG